VSRPPEPPASPPASRDAPAPAPGAASPADPAPPALVEVALALPLPAPLHYRIPDRLAGELCRGMRVLVPLGGRQVTGYVTDFPGSSSVPPGRLREVLGALDEGPLFDEELLALVLLAARYYVQPPGELLRAALPAGINVTGRRTVRRVPAGEPPAAASLPGGTVAAAPRSREPQRRALRTALEERPVPCDELLRRVGQGCRFEDLLALQREGSALLDFDLPRPRVRSRKTQLLTPAGPARPAVHLGSRQQELLRLVHERPGISLAEARRAIPDAAAVSRALEAKGLIRRAEVEELRDPFLDDPVVPDQAPVLSAGQQGVLQEIGQALTARRFTPFLLHGETGSGKTEVYLEAIRLARAQGRSALVLVPEISLTPQLAGRFRARFGDRAVAVLHSGLSEGERYDQWRRLRQGEVTLAVGARSAVFAPLPALGIVVVDEEHDPSYHQDESPRYDGRNLALLRGSRSDAVVVLGSATPSLESHYHALTGRYRRLELKGRPTGGALPQVELVDLRLHRPARGVVPFTRPLREALLETLGAGEQAILFLNRRGWAPVLLCQECGAAITCPSCSVTLTLHREDARLRCHYCDHQQRVPSRCPACAAEALVQLGLGTEKVEAAVRELLPGARVARLDRDTVGRKGLAGLLRAVRAREVDVLVGTQMVTKGHDFPGVTLVGVLQADGGLHLPDFRAAERTFQLLAQVAGRAGRGERPGRVIIQTYSPEHHALTAAQGHDHLGFAQQELLLRRELGFPPFSHLVALHLDGPDAEATRAVVEGLGRELEELLVRPGAPPVTLLGPAPAPLEQLRGRYRWQLLLKAASRPELRTLLPSLQELVARAQKQGLRGAVDVDPVSML